MAAQVALVALARAGQVAGRAGVAAGRATVAAGRATAKGAAQVARAGGKAAGSTARATGKATGNAARATGRAAGRGGRDGGRLAATVGRAGRNAGGAARTAGRAGRNGRGFAPTPGRNAGRPSSPARPGGRGPAGHPRAATGPAPSPGLLPGRAGTAARPGGVSPGLRGAGGRTGQAGTPAEAPGQGTPSLRVAPRDGQIARGALRTAGKVLRVWRLGRFVRKRLPHRKLRERLRKTRGRARRRVRLIVLGVVLMWLAFAGLAATLVNDAAAVLSGGEGGPLGFVDGVPFADAFNETAALGIDPRLVAAVAWAESGFARDVIACERLSSAGAMGIMQLLPGTAAELGVDPCDPPAAIQGGARYLLQQYERFGSWELALAAYNAGPGAVEAAGGVPVNGETEHYVPKVMAKWNEYILQFPSATVSGAGTPLGSTARYTESRITAKTQHLLDVVIPIFGQGHDMHCFRNGSRGEHPLGRACDFIISARLNTMPTADEIAHGWRFSNYLVANAQNLEVDYVIWQGQIWSWARRTEGWRTYYAWPEACTPGPPPNCNLQQNHYDHIHVSVKP